MIHSRQRNKIVDYLGTHQHLAVDLDLRPDARGGLRLRSGEQRFYEGPIAFRFPMLFSGIADVCEWYDEPTSRFRIEVEVTNRVWGKLFGYSGSFKVQWLPMTADQIPARAKPYREENASRWYPKDNCDKIDKNIPPAERSVRAVSAISRL